MLIIRILRSGLALVCARTMLWRGEHYIEVIRKIVRKETRLSAQVTWFYFYTMVLSGSLLTYELMSLQLELNTLFPIIIGGGILIALYVKSIVIFVLYLYIVCLPPILLIGIHKFFLYNMSTLTPRRLLRYVVWEEMICPPYEIRRVIWYLSYNTTLLRIVPLALLGRSVEKVLLTCAFMSIYRAMWVYCNTEEPIYKYFYGLFKVTAGTTRSDGLTLLFMILYLFLLYTSGFMFVMDALIHIGEISKMVRRLCAS